MKIRTLKAENSNIQPTTPKEWEAVCRKALVRAEALGDRRAAGLRTALEKKTCRNTLLLLGVVCDADINRLFPAE